MPTDFAVLSSGDSEEDRRIAQRFEQSSARIESGMCPNGCGGMVEVDSHNAECPRCHFAYFSAAGLDFKAGGTQ